MDQVEVSPKVAAILLKPGKDSRWLTLEVCREFAREACPRSEDECKYAHPPSQVEVQNGKVICCFDFIKSKCQRNNPPCKYLHPPSHLKEQLLETGRQNLIVKNLQLQSALNNGLLQPILAVSGGSSIPLMTTSKPVMQSAYQAMIMPGQQQFAQSQPFSYQATGSPYVIPSPSQMLPQYQILGSAQGGLSGYPTNGLVQVMNSSHYTNYIQVGLLNGSSNYPFQVLPYVDPMSSMDSAMKAGSTVVHQSQAFQSYGISEDKSPGSGSSRKRIHDSSAVVQSGGVVQPSKRMALVDAKSGLPVYAPQLSLASMPLQQQYFPISLAPQHATLLQRF